MAYFEAHSPGRFRRMELNERADLSAPEPARASRFCSDVFQWLIRPMATERAGRIAVLADPQGAMFELFQTVTL